ncbi:MAG: hypothetical protein IPO92_10810 [Saprospiraceae bacterium]|nr:hypothetical protein [Saprospiraceae bacterium]
MAVHVCVLAQAGPVGPAVVGITLNAEAKQLSVASNVGAVIDVGLHAPAGSALVTTAITGITTSSTHV